MTDCHDWFAEVAEAFVRYAISHAGFEVFGQSEWGADVAIHDRAGRWSRCEVRSSSVALKPRDVRQKDSEKLREIAEIEAIVWMVAPSTLNLRFIQLNDRGQRRVSASGTNVSHDYNGGDALKQWLTEYAFWRVPPPAIPDTKLSPGVVTAGPTSYGSPKTL